MLGLDRRLSPHKLICFFRRSLLDSLLVQLSLENAFHEDAGRVNQVGFQFAYLDQMLDFAMVTFAAVAIIGLKLRAVLR